MSAKPARRRTSKLAAEHPAWPTPTAAPVAPDVEQPTPAPGPDQSDSLARTRVRAQPEDEQARIAAAQVRTQARNAAWGWASARRKLDRRSSEWAAALARAREHGVLPGVLGDYIREATARGGIDPADVPAEVWQAAGLTPP